MISSLCFKQLTLCLFIFLSLEIRSLNAEEKHYSPVYGSYLDTEPLSLSDYVSTEIKHLVMSLQSFVDGSVSLPQFKDPNHFSFGHYTYQQTLINPNNISYFSEGDLGYKFFNEKSASKLLIENNAVGRTEMINCIFLLVVCLVALL